MAAVLGAVLVVPAVVAPTAAVVGGANENTAYGFTARLMIGDAQRACSGVLVADQWILSASSCFVEDPSEGLLAAEGQPAVATVATVGRADLTGTAGFERDVVRLVPHESRDLVLARLDAPVSVDPVALSTASAAAGEDLELTGFGRTATEWAPLLMHRGDFHVDSVAGSDVAVTGLDGDAVCAGDTGAPVLRATGSGTELVAIASRSWQAGCFGVDPAETRTSAVAVRTDDTTSWIADVTSRPRITDFDCDGLADVAVGDPDATVDGHPRAGLVRVMYGDGAVATLTQESYRVPGNSEDNDRFGFRLATYDRNQDGCTDLAVGAPFEDLSGATDTGWVNVIHGSPEGLTNGPASVEYVQGGGDGSLAASASEAGDKLGYSLAAGHTSDDTPWIAMGAFGEDLDGGDNAGQVFYVQGSRTSKNINQDREGVPNTAESADRYGMSLAGDSNFLVIGAPDEKLLGKDNSGLVHVFSHTLRSDGRPTFVAELNQNVAGVSGGSQAGDRFGESLAITGYRPAGASAPSDSLLVVGSPGESIVNPNTGADRSNAGRIVTFHFTDTGDWTEVGAIAQDADGVPGAPEVDDAFGEDVTIVSTDPADGGSDTIKVAVGVPGEKLSDHADAGLVQVFTGIESLDEPVATEFWLIPGSAGMPGSSGAGQRLGGVLSATHQGLQVGLPNGPATFGSVHSIPWSNLTDGATLEPVTTYAPGTGGIPASGSSFGSSIS